jgi:putative cardiolipin synthase
MERRALRDFLAGGKPLRLHAKVAVIDRELVFMALVNFDPHSHELNTELGLLIRSPALAEQMHALSERLKREGSHRLRLDTDGRTLPWADGDGDAHTSQFGPGNDAGRRPLLGLQEPLVTAGDALGPGPADGMIAPRDKSEFAFQIKHLA